jgi:hypothetical protein
MPELYQASLPEEAHKHPSLVLCKDWDFLNTQGKLKREKDNRWYSFPLKIVLVLPIKDTCLVGSIECNTIVVPTKVQFELGSSSRDDK